MKRKLVPMCYCHTFLVVEVRRWPPEVGITKLKHDNNDIDATGEMDSPPAPSVPLQWQNLGAGKQQPSRDITRPLLLLCFSCWVKLSCSSLDQQGDV